MVLYSNEARESWKAKAKEISKKAYDREGLNYADVRCLTTMLNMFCEYVDKEDREVKGTDHRAKRMAHGEIVGSVVKELHDKNPDLDIIKMCVRIAIAGCSIEWTTDELKEMTLEIADAIPFDPLSPCKLA